MVRRQLWTRGRDERISTTSSTHAAARLDPATHLLVGPWVHGVESTAKNKSGEREFGANAAIDYDEVVLRWMDHYVRGIDNSVEREEPVRYFVMGVK